jgi:hypothetical protein
VGNKGFDWLKEIVQKRRSDHLAGRASALELWELLIRFARECHERACYNLDHDDGYVSLPDLPSYPDEIAWALLPAEIASELRALRIKIDEARSVIRWVDEFYDQRDVVVNATNSFISLGNEALALSDGLGKRYEFARDRCGFVSNLRKLHRQRRRGPLRRAWASLPVYKFRRYVRRLTWQAAKGIRRPLMAKPPMRIG